MKKPGIIILVVVLLLIIAAPVVYFLTVPQKKTTVNVYGVDGIGNSPTMLTRTDDAVDMKYSFSEGFKSDFDKVYPWSHMTTVKDQHDNVFVKIPKFYSKYTMNADGSVKLQIANAKLDGFSTLFIDGKGNEIDYVLVGAYEATGTSEQIFSKGGDFPLTGLNIDQFRTASRANGDGYQQFDFLIMSIINQLFTVEFATTDSQSIFYGYMYKTVSGSVMTGLTDVLNNSTGYFDSGVFKYRGIENIWGNKFKFVDGITFNGVNIYLSTDPSKYVAGNEYRNDSYKLIGIDRPVTEGRARGLKVDPSNSALAFINGTISLDISSEYNLADYYYQKDAGEVMTYGGPSGYGQRGGIWCFYGDQKPTSANTALTTRLCYKPINGFIET